MRRIAPHLPLAIPAGTGSVGGNTTFAAPSAQRQPTSACGRMVYCSEGVSSHNDLGLAQRIEDLAVEQPVARARSFRIAPVLETGAERYAWLNNMRFPPNMV